MEMSLKKKVRWMINKNSAMNDLVGFVSAYHVIDL